MEISSQTKIYHPRDPQESPLWQLLNAHFAEFESCYDRRFARDYGFYRAVVPHVVNNYLECGDLNEGRRSLAILAYLLVSGVLTVIMNICLHSHVAVVGSVPHAIVKR
jgi:hypothetical protein